MKTFILMFLLLAVGVSAQVTGRFAPGLNKTLRVGITNTFVEPYPPTVLGYEFNEGTGSSLSASAGSVGTISGGTWVTGASGSGFAYDSDGDTTGQSDNPITFGANIITVTCWLKCTAWGVGGVTGRILQSGVTGWGGTANAWRIYDDEGAISVAMTGDTAASFSDWQIDGGFVNNTWFHLAVVFNGSVASGSAKVYINGAQVSITASGTARDGTSNFSTAVVNILDSDSLDDQMDDMRIYSGELNSGQINQIYLHPR